MTSFLFIPATAASSTRRVDFGNIGSLFAEIEEPARRGADRRDLVRMAMAALLVLMAIGDTVLVTRPSALMGCPVPHTAPVRATL